MLRFSSPWHCLSWHFSSPYQCLWFAPSMSQSSHQPFDRTERIKLNSELAIIALRSNGKIFKRKENQSLISISKCPFSLYKYSSIETSKISKDIARPWAQSMINIRVILTVIIIIIAWAFRQVQLENCQNHEYLGYYSRIVQEGRAIFYL